MTALRAARPLAAASLLLAADGALAAPADGFALAVTPSQIVLLSAIVGLTAFALWAVVMTMRARQQAESGAAALRTEVADLKAAADRTEALINGEDQRFVVWGTPGESPLVAGRLATDSAPTSGPTVGL